MMSKNAVRSSIALIIIVGLTILLANVWSRRGLVLVAKDDIPVYATQEDATKSPPPSPLARLASGQSVPVKKCVDVKHYFIYKVRLADGRDGFVLEGEYSLMRGDEEAFCP
jgi:hypothetical protein